MKVTQKHLDRLFKSAAAAPRPEAGAMPFGFETRVLAGLGSSPESDELAGLLVLFRAGLAFACVLLILTAALSFRAQDETAQDDFATSNAMVRLASIP